jgi:dihydroxyacetone kinase-like protein
MVDSLNVTTFKRLLQNALERIKEQEDELSRLDALTGDGDHGMAIVAALSTAVKVAEKGMDFKTMLNDMGFAVMMETGGSTSTLLGAFFLGMSDGASGTELNVAEVKVMFSEGLANVRKQTKAGVGDKTMMDVLMPAVDALVACESGDMSELFTAAAVAARQGAEATVDMVARYGRARNYGERSKGVMDAGAASWSSLFAGFDSFFQHRDTEDTELHREKK